MVEKVGVQSVQVAANDAERKVRVEKVFADVLIGRNGITQYDDVFFEA